MANSPESTTADELLQANQLASTDAAKAEELYRGILSRQTSTFNLPFLHRQREAGLRLG